MAFILELEDIRVCHLGDLGHTPTAEQVEELSEVDILLVPVGGLTTIDGATAAEVGRHGIRANAIAPGLIYNEFLERIYPKEFFEAFTRRVPLGRVGEPSDVADLALFLASDMSRYITGEVVCISGGGVVVP